MKKLNVLKLTFLFILTLIMSSTLEAQTFYYPSDGDIFVCPEGTTSTWVPFAWYSGYIWPDQTSNRTVSGFTGNNSYYLLDGVLYYGTSGSILESVGNHTVYVDQYQEYFQYTANGGYTYPVWTGYDRVTIFVITPTHGNKSCVADLANPGQKQYTQTSDYISAGSIVNCSVHIDGYNYGTTFISASASVAGFSVSRETNQQGGTIEQSSSGTYTMSAGGTLTLYANVFVGTQGGQAYAYSTISW